MSETKYDMGMICGQLFYMDIFYTDTIELYRRLRSNNLLFNITFN